MACGFTPRTLRGVSAGAEPEVRIHLPPAASLRTVGPASLPRLGIAVVGHVGPKYPLILAPLPDGALESLPAISVGVRRSLTEEGVTTGPICHAVSGWSRAREQGKRERGRIDPALSALAVPTASEAPTAMKPATVEAAEATDVGDTHVMCETATSKMGGAKAAIHTYGATHPRKRSYQRNWAGVVTARLWNSALVLRPPQQSLFRRMGAFPFCGR
jgi:hypothetical protein